MSKFGFFIWRRGLRGPESAICHEERLDIYDKTNLISQHPLTKEQAKLSRHDLSVLFPGPAAPAEGPKIKLGKPT